MRKRKRGKGENEKKLKSVKESTALEEMVNSFVCGHCSTYQDLCSQPCSIYHVQWTIKFDDNSKMVVLTSEQCIVD
jgi:hypothetical protein